MSAFDPPAPPDAAKVSRLRHPVVLAAASIAALVAVLAAIGAIRHKPAPPAPALATATVTVGDAPAPAPGAATAAPAPPPRIGMRPAFGDDAPMRAGARLAWASSKPGTWTRQPPTDETAWVPRAARTVAAGAEIGFADAPRNGPPRGSARASLSGFVRVETDGKYTLRADVENATPECVATVGGVKFAALDWRNLTDGQTLPLQAGYHAVSLLCAFSVGIGGTARLSILPDGADTPTPMQLFLPAPSPAPAPKKADVLAGEPDAANGAATP